MQDVHKNIARCLLSNSKGFGEPSPHKTTLQCKGSAPKSHSPFLVPQKAAIACSNGVEIFYQTPLPRLDYSNFFRSSTSGNASRSFSGMSEFMR